MLIPLISTQVLIPPLEPVISVTRALYVCAYVNSYLLDKEPGEGVEEHRV